MQNVSSDYDRYFLFRKIIDLLDHCVDFELYVAIIVPCTFGMGLTTNHGIVSIQFYSTKMEFKN